MATKKTTLNSTISEKVLDANKQAIKIYDDYKSVSDLIKKVDDVLGRDSQFTTGAKSTLNFEINYNGVRSTTQSTITS